MTTEQREAIDNIKIFIRSIRSDLAEESEDNQELADSLDTALSLIKEQDREIKDIERALHDEILENYDKEELLNKRLKQKDKQIDLMARAFKQDDIRTVEEIKQYFERKAKE